MGQIGTSRTRELAEREFSERVREKLDGRWWSMKVNLFTMSVPYIGTRLRFPIYRYPRFLYIGTETRVGKPDGQ